MGPGTTRSTASAAVEAVLGAVLALTEQGEPLRITRFGTFRRCRRPARRAYHIPDGAVREVAPQSRLTFTPSSTFPDRL